MDLLEALLDSWDRECRIVKAVAGRVDESNRHLKPSPDGWSIDFHLAHMHQVRRYFLGQLNEAAQQSLGPALSSDWEHAIEDLGEIKRLLDQSGVAVGNAVQNAVEAGNNKAGWYDNPVLYL